MVCSCGLAPQSPLSRNDHSLRGYLFPLSFFLRGPSRIESFQPLGDYRDLWVVDSWIPLGHFFFPLVSFSPSRTPFLQPLGIPADRAPFNLFPLPTFGGSLLSLLQPLSGPSSSFVALRGYLFSFVVFRGSPSWISFFPFFLRGPSRTPFESFPTPWSPFAD